MICDKYLWWWPLLWWWPSFEWWWYPPFLYPPPPPPPQLCLSPSPLLQLLSPPFEYFLSSPILPPLLSSQDLLSSLPRWNSDFSPRLLMFWAACNIFRVKLQQEMTKSKPGTGFALPCMPPPPPYTFSPSLFSPWTFSPNVINNYKQTVRQTVNNHLSIKGRCLAYLSISASWSSSALLFRTYILELTYIIFFSIQTSIWISW